METEESNSRQSNGQMCAVCGTRLNSKQGYLRTNHRGNTINLCGSQCLDTFAEEPDLYLARLAELSERMFAGRKNSLGNQGFQLRATYQETARDSGGHLAGPPSSALE